VKDPAVEETVDTESNNLYGVHCLSETVIVAAEPAAGEKVSNEQTWRVVFIGQFTAPVSVQISVDEVGADWAGIQNILYTWAWEVIFGVITSGIKWIRVPKIQSPAPSIIAGLISVRIRFIDNETTDVCASLLVGESKVTSISP
jgi:hypothetical protein